MEIVYTLNFKPVILNIYIYIYSLKLSRRG